MFEIDFLAVSSNLDSGGKKSGDAIAVRFTDPGGAIRAIVIDGGYEPHGDDLVARIRREYGTNYVDAVISTHPDRDHIGGLVTVLEELGVGELLIHQPRLHAGDVQGFSNLTGVDKLLQVAKDRGIPVVSPFTGLTRFGGALQVLSPTQTVYEALVAQHLADQRSALEAKVAASLSLANLPVLRGSGLGTVLPFLPVETLTDDGDTGPRNDSSVVLLLQVDGHHLMFTADAGIPALSAAADRYETVVGPFWAYPLTFFQGPHHGSHHNVGPSVLDRLLGSPSCPHGSAASLISAARDDVKHPSPKVTNALQRRGCDVVVTDGHPICFYHGAPPRLGWSPVTPVPALEEDDDDA